MRWPWQKKPELKGSALSEFMRNASAREQKRVYMRVIDRAIEAQRKIIRKADEIEARERAGRDASGGPVQEPA